jgi:uncharacterized repeat protein (TIGR01451 family)
MSRRITLVIAWVALGLALVGVAMVPPRAAGQATSTSGFTVDQTYDAIWGNISPGDAVTVARGTAYGAAQADGIGFFWTPLWLPSGQPADITSADTLGVYVNGNLSATITVSGVTGLVDVLNDRIVGTISGAASVPVTVSLGVDPGAPSVATTTDASGRFTATFATVDLAANQNVAVEYRSGPHTVRAFLAPSLVFMVDIGWSEITGYAQPGQVVTTTVYTGTSSLVKTVIPGQADKPQGFYDLYPSDGTAINGGDKVEVNLGGGTIISTTAATITHYTDVGANRVTGTVPPGAAVRASLWRLTDDKNPYYQVRTTADASGIYTADFGGVTNLQVFDWIQVAVADSKGNETALSSGAPMINVNETGDQGWARVDGPNLTVTSTLDTGSNIYTQTSVSGANGFVSIQRFPGDPDIQPGHRVTVETASWLGAMTVADINVTFDMAGNRLMGNTPAGRVETTISHPWSDRYPAGLGAVRWQVTATSPFTITFANFDVRDEDNLWIGYYNSDGFRTVRSINTRYFEVNAPYGVGAPQFSPSDVLTATLYQSDGVTVKRKTSQDNDSNPTWYWMDMQGQIAVGDWVTVTDSAGWTAGLRVPTLTLQVSETTDLVWGQGPKALLFVEHNWGKDGWNGRFVPCDDYKVDAAYFGEDIQQGDSVDVVYKAPNGDRVVRWMQLAPNLRINQQPQGTPGEGGNMIFRIEYWNDGDLPAENTLITDTLEGMSYISALSPVTPTGSGSGPMVWSLGTLPAQSYGQFDVFVHVTSPASNTITNTVQIATSNPYDQGSWDQKNGTWTGHVETNDTHLNVNKDVWTGDPLPGSDFVWSAQVCNNGSTDSSEVILTDTLPLSTTLVSWWGQHPGWTEISHSDNQLVVSRPSMRNGGWCTQVYIHSRLDANAIVDTQLTNMAVITATNDMESDDNSSTRDINVGRPHANLYVNKQWNWGELTPGGELRYGIDYGNNGNLPVSGVRITDTLPVSTTFIGAWRNDNYWWNVSYPVTPVLVTANTVVWDIGALDNGYGDNFEVALRVDNHATPGAVLTNTVSISPQPDEDAYYDNTSTVVETLRGHGPNLRVRKSYRWNGDEHTQLNYDVVFENVGDQTVNDVWITDTYPLSTSLSGSPWWDYWEQVNWTDNYTDSQLIFQLQELRPGWRSELYFNVNVDPSLRPRWYTNTVEIGPLAGDVNPADNTYTDVVVSAEVDRAELWMNLAGSSNMWGQAVPGTVTITTAYTQVTAFADPACGGCWPNGGPNPDVGPVQPGDAITVTAGNGLLPVVINVPHPFTAQADSSADRVQGQVGGWTNQIVEIHSYWSGGYKEVATDAAGYYTATYSDVPRDAQGYVRFVTQVAYADVIFHHPFLTQDLVLNVHYRDDWVEGNYPAGYTVLITVTEGSGALKGTAVLTTGVVPWWGGQTGFSTNWQGWMMRPDIVPGDWVYGRVVENGYTTTVRVGTITGNVDAAGDRITGTITADWYTQTLAVRCDPWGAPPNTPNKQSSAGPDGDPPYSCQWNPATEWDVLPGQDIAVWYYTPDANQVGNAFQEPAPHLNINKWADGNPGEGGNLVFHIQYSNNGDAPAENTVITDTMLGGMTYLTDTSTFTHTGSGSGPIVWNLGSVPANSSRQFDIYAQITAAQSETITNTAQIATSNPYDQGDPGEKQSTWSGQVLSNGTRLKVDKGAWTGDPAAGQDVVFNANVCNNGGPDATASSRVYLTDTLNLSMTLRYWWGQTPGWTPVISNTGQLVVYKESLSAGQCDQVYLRVHLDPSLTPGTSISNTAVISAGNDLTGDDNESTWWGSVGNPRTTLYLDKQWSWGRLVPGGEIRYNISYNNNGNLPVTQTIRLTDTLPVSTTFIGAWRYDDLGPHPVAPVLTGTSYVVWQINSLDNGYGDNLDVALKIDNNALPGTVLTNCAAIAANIFEDDPYDNAQCAVEILRAPGANLRVTKFAYWQGAGGMQYQVRIENIGTTTVNTVTITDTYPASMTLDNWNINVPGDWGPWSSGQSGNQLTVTLDRLESGWTTWLNMWLSVPGTPNGVLFTNTVAVTTPPDDVNPADNSAVNVMGTGPDLSVEKWLTGGAPKPGQLLTFTLHFRNQAQAWGTLGNVWITDTLPSGLEFVNATQRLCGSTYFCDRGPDYNDGATLSWNYGGMCPDCWNDILVTARVADTAQGGDVLTNTAAIASDDAGDVEPYYDNNTSAYALTVLNPVFRVDKVYQSSRVAGTPVTYTLTVTNTGNDAGTNARLIDWLPDWVTYGGGGDGYGAGLITWTIPSVAPNNGTATRWFSGTLSCSANAVATNQYYRVDSSDQGVTSTNGLSVTFTTLAPTLNAAFNQSASSAVVSTTFFFTDTSTTNGTAIAARTWSFGDGSTASGQLANHTYLRHGTFTVQLTITDTCGYSQSHTATVRVNPPTIAASFDYTPKPALIVVSDTVYFTDTSTTNVPPIVGWLWTFGDGALSAARNPMTDSLGYTATQSAANAVVVRPVCEPVAGLGFSYTPMPAFVQQMTTFTATYTSGVPAPTFAWSFDGGAAMAGSSVAYTFSTTGTHTVALTATNTCGATPYMGTVNVETRRVYLPVVMRN